MAAVSTRWNNRTSRPIRTVLVAGVVVAAAACSHTAPSRTLPPQRQTAPPLAEGTPGWEIDDQGPVHEIEGFADHVSALPGDKVKLFISTTAPNYRIEAFRFGNYRNSAALRVWEAKDLPGKVQAPSAFIEPTRTVVAPWEPSLTVDTQNWTPGDYLFRLESSTGARQYIPLTVRQKSNKGRIVIVNATTTWQAYNKWGGYSLYESPSEGKAGRSRVVSFDRPYEAGVGKGAGDFTYFELPFVLWAERQGYDLGYATDNDLDADPHLLDGAAGVVTLSHDEYWSPKMRNAMVRARDSGTNWAFLGGNDAYRHMRFEASPLGPNRTEVDYKSFDEDPIHESNPDGATQEWRSPPNEHPESAILGNYYHCNPVTADLVVADDKSWLTNGLVSPGEHLPNLVGDEYNAVDLKVPTPRPLQVLFHSPVSCRTHPEDFADVTYYTTGSGAGVFAAGTEYWVCGIDPWCKRADAPEDRVRKAVQGITRRLLDAFSKGPVGKDHPAQDNLVTLGIPEAVTYPNPSTPNGYVPE